MRHAVSAEAVRAVMNEGRWTIGSRSDVDLALTGCMTPMLREAVRRDLLVPGTQARVDAVSASILMHRGINPAVLFAICIHATDAEVNDETGMQVAALGSDGYCHVRLNAADGPDWRTMGGYLGNLPRVPRIAAVAATGRPLRETVSHPALDPLGLTVASIEDIFDHSAVIVDGFSWLEAEHLTRLLDEEKAPCA